MTDTLNRVTNHDLQSATCRNDIQMKILLAGMAEVCS